MSTGDCHFTLSDRGGGLGLGAGSWKLPLYVVGKDVERNTLVVGRAKELKRKSFWVEEVNFINPKSEILNSKSEFVCLVRIRHQGELKSAKLKVQNAKLVRVELEEPMRGIAPGQSAVFYRRVGSWRWEVGGGDVYEVLGGGVIAS